MLSKTYLTSQFLRISNNNSDYGNKTTEDTVWRNGGTPLRNQRDRRLHSVTKSLNLSPQCS